MSTHEDVEKVIVDIGGAADAEALNQAIEHERRVIKRGGRSEMIGLMAAILAPPLIGDIDLFYPTGGKRFHTYGSRFAGRPSDEELKRQRSLPGRNDPCHCGSGKKFKKCHGINHPSQESL